MMSHTAAITPRLLPIPMQMAVDLPMTGHQETFLPGSQHTLEKDMRETTIVVDATGKFYSPLFLSLSLLGPALYSSAFPYCLFLYVFYFIRSLSWRNWP
jgi:hypothetical protein